MSENIESPPQSPQKNEEKNLSKAIRAKESPNNKQKPTPKAGKQKVLEFETMKLPKIYTPYTYIMFSNKLAEAKEKFKESLKEVGVEVEESLKWPEKRLKGEEALKKSVSVKYLGVKDGQIGILSKRVPISTEKPKKKPKANVDLIDNREYLVNKYSLPHQLHAVFPKTQKPLKDSRGFLDGLSMGKNNKSRRKTTSLEENAKEMEIKRKIQRMIEKKKEILREKAQIKMKNSMEAWDFLINANEKMSQKNLKGFSYSSKVKSLEGESNEKNKDEISKLIQKVFLHR